MEADAQQNLPPGQTGVVIDGVDQAEARILPGQLLLLEVREGPGQVVLQLAVDLGGHLGGGAQHGVASQLVPQPTPLMPIHPTEDPGELCGRSARGEAMGPVLRQAVVLGHGF